MTPNFALDPVDSYFDAAGRVLEQGFAVLNIGNRVPWATAAPIFRGLAALREMPLEEQERWSIDRSCGNPVDPDDGLILRRPDKENPGAFFDPSRPSDHKDIFMCRKGVRAGLAQLGLGCGEEWRGFWEAQEALWNVSMDIALNVGQQFDIHTSDRYALYDRIFQNRNQSKLRTQTYLDARSDDSNTIAGSHTDRTCLSVHLFENHRGLVLLLNGQRIPIAASEGRAIVFAGDQLQEITGGTPYFVDKGGKQVRRLRGGLVEAVEHGAEFVDTEEHPWPGYRNMGVFFTKGIRDLNDNPWDT